MKELALLMKKLTARQKREIEKKLDKEAQVFRYLMCDEYEVRWNGEQWECTNCHQYYGNKTEISVL